MNPIPYRALEAVLHDAPEALAVMALRDVDDATRYGSVETRGAIIRGFHEKTADGKTSRGRVNAGVYLMRREAIESLPEQQSSLETDVFPQLASNGRLFGVLREGYFIDIGLPETLDQARRELPSALRRPALFLDRDGVMNIDHGYVHCWDQLDLLTGLAEVIRAFNEAGWFVFVITNQAGVARGYYDESAVNLLHDQIRDWLAPSGAHVDRFYYCPMHPKGSIAEYCAESIDRKPGPGMLLRAFAEWPVELAHSFLVGDQETDMAAAVAAGIKGHLFQGADVARFFFEQGLWPRHPNEADRLALDETNRDRECFG
jgi:D-glycero-D-manno-heptose 1,7-bisphosphate phosphatase